MRINVYAEELLDVGEGELLRIERVSKTAETGRTYYGVRIYLRSPKELHAELADDDRSAITFWGPRAKVADLLMKAALCMSPGCCTPAGEGVSLTEDEVQRFLDDYTSRPMVAVTNMYKTLAAARR